MRVQAVKYRAGGHMGSLVEPWFVSPPKSGIFPHWVCRMEKLQIRRQVRLHFLVGKGQECQCLTSLPSPTLDQLTFLRGQSTLFCSHRHPPHVRHQRSQDKPGWLNPNSSSLLAKHSAHGGDCAGRSTLMWTDGAPFRGRVRLQG